MSAGAAVLGIWAALLAGWYAAKWHTAETDEISARNRLANAVRVMWAARRVLFVVALIGILLVSLWFHGHGR